MAEYTPEPQKRDHRMWFVLLAVVSGIAVFTVFGIFAFQDGGSSPTKSDRGASAPAQTQPEEKAGPNYNLNPKVSEFDISLKTTSKQCYGSGLGCDMFVEPEIAYTGWKELDPNKTYTITYEITGDEMGPVIESADLDNQTELTYFESWITTPDSTTTPTVEVTDVQVYEYGW